MQEKKLKNKSADKKQYEKYKAVLGKKEVGSFDEFQEMKYNSEKWNNLKQTIRKSVDGETDLQYNEEKPRTQQELQKAAEKMKVLAEQYSVNPSKWSGNIIVNNELFVGNAHGRKEWNCDIIVVDYADDGVILHEILHSCSSSHYDPSVFQNNQFIEEGSVEFLKQQICKEKNIKSVKGYTIFTEALEAINKNFCYGTDLEFAKELFNVPFPKRHEWLRDKVDKSLKQMNVSFKDYIETMELIENLKGNMK